MTPSAANIVSGAWKASAGGIFAIIVFGAFINLLKFAMPLYTLQILDRIPQSGSIQTLAMLTVIALLAVLSGVSLEAIRRRMLVSWSGWVNRLVGPHLVEAGIGSASGGKTPRASRGLDHLQAIRHFIEKSSAALFDLLWVPAFVAVVFAIHPMFGTIMLLVMGLRLLLGYAQHQLMRPDRQQWSNASREARSLVDSAERQGDAIGATAMARNLSLRWLESTRTKLAERETSHNHDSLFAAVNTGLYRSLYVAGMGVGVWLVVQGNLTIGGVIAVNIIMRFGFRILDRGVRRWESLNRARRAYRWLRRRLNRMQSDVFENEWIVDPGQPLVLENVSHRYRGQRRSVLRRIDLEIQPGKMLCVIGRSASGKSSFARLCAGLMSPRRGSVRLGDIDLSTIPASKRQQVVGYLSEEAQLFSGSVRDNIASLAQADKDTVIDAAMLAGIHERIEQLPEGYDTQVDDRTQLLSAGERRRLLLARAFFGRPRLVVLDEPAAHLDRPGRNQLIEAINTLKAGGSSIVVTSQSNRLGQIADQTYMLGRRKQNRSASRRDQVAAVETLQTVNGPAITKEAL